MDEPTIARYRVEAQARLRHARDHHGVAHATRVWDFARDLARHHTQCPAQPTACPQDAVHVGGPADMAVLETAVWWHDVGHLQGRASHAARSAAQVARYLAEQHAPPAFIEAVVATIGPHSWDGEPWTLEGVLLREADKLDYLPVARHQRILALIAAGDLSPHHYQGILPRLARFPDWFSLARARVIHDELRPTLDRFLCEQGVIRL